MLEKNSMYDICGVKYEKHFKKQKHEFVLQWM